MALFAIDTPGGFKKWCQQEQSKLRANGSGGSGTPLGFLSAKAIEGSVSLAPEAKIAILDMIERARALSSHRVALLDEVLCPSDAKRTSSVFSFDDACDLWGRLCSPKLDGYGVYMVFSGALSELAPGDVECLRILLQLGIGKGVPSVEEERPELLRRMTSERKRPRHDENEERKPAAAGVASLVETAPSPLLPVPAPKAKAKGSPPPAAAGGAGPVLVGKALAPCPVSFAPDQAGTSPAPTAPIDPEHPQRVSDCSIDKVVRRMGRAGSSLSFVADMKYDGERLIGFRVDRSSGWKFFSRNMLVVPERKLEHVREALNKSFIGNIPVVFDAEILSKHTFGSMNKVKKFEFAETNPIRIYIFDILWVNGHNLQHMPLEKRRLVQRHLVKVQPNLIEHGESTLITPSGGSHTEGCVQLQAVFDKTIGDKLEGVVVKPWESPYHCGGTHWVKLKRDYVPTSAGTTTADRTFAGTTATRFVMKNVPKGPGGATTATAPPPPPLPTGTVLSDPGSSAGALTLRDTLDLLVVGRLSDNRLVVALRDDTTLRKFVVVGTVRDTSSVCGGVLRAGKPSSIDDLRSGDVLFPNVSSEGGLRALLPSFSSFQKDRDRCVVVEVSAKKIVDTLTASTSRDAGAHDAEVLTDAAGGPASLPWTLSSDANVVRLREDKSPNEASSLSAFKALTVEASLKAHYSFDTACDFASENTLDVDFAGAEDDEWEEASKTVPLVKRDLKASATAALSGMLTSKKPPVGAAQFLLVPVAKERPWSDRGLMGEVTRSLGPKPKNHCDSVIARKTCRPGSIVVSEITWGEAAPFHCAIVSLACLEFPTDPTASKGPPSLSPTQMTTALRRIRNLAVSLLRGAVQTPTNGVQSIVFHIEEKSFPKGDYEAGMTMVRRVLLAPLSRERDSVIRGKPTLAGFAVELIQH